MTIPIGQFRSLGTSYRVFGLSLVADFQFPEFLPSVPAVPDLRIEKASVPWVDRPDDLFISGDSPKELTLNVADTVRMQVTSDSIRYQPLAGATDHAVRHVLADMGLGLVLLLRNTPPLHASAVRLPDGGAIAFCGAQGAGKSTLSAAFCGCGYPKVADDIAALRPGEEGEILVEPGVGHSKLLLDALGHLKIPLRDFQLVSGKQDKFLVPLDLWKQAEPLRYVVELVVMAEGPVNLTQVRGVEKIALLDKHTFGSEVMHFLGLREMHLRWLTDLAARVPVYRLTRPPGEDTLAELIGKLELLWGAPARSISPA